jgi:hypothetical protein
MEPPMGTAPKKKGMHFGKNFEDGEENLHLVEVNLKDYR